jgi:hypothetical protein
MLCDAACGTDNMKNPPNQLAKQIVAECKAFSKQIAKEEKEKQKEQQQ